MFRNIYICWFINILQYALVDLPWDSVWTWLAAFVVCDLAYYIFHRALHEVHLLWYVFIFFILNDSFN